MADWLPGITKQSWGKDGGSFLGGPPRCVIHTTEGRSWPSYSDGSMAPHFTILPLPGSRSLAIRQHSPVNKAARALANASGGVETNRRSAIQIELVGTCTTGKTPDWFFWPGADDWALEALGNFLAGLSGLCGFRLLAPDTPFLSYPASYGNAKGQRFTADEWNGYNGICGHQHVPENSHGDPGNINIAKILAYATGNTSDKDDDMTPEQQQKLDDTHRMLTQVVDWMQGPPNVSPEVSSGFAHRIARIEAAVDALGGAVTPGDPNIDVLTRAVTQRIAEKTAE